MFMFLRITDRNEVSNLPHYRKTSFVEAATELRSLLCSFSLASRFLRKLTLHPVRKCGPACYLDEGDEYQCKLVKSPIPKHTSQQHNHITKCISRVLSVIRYMWRTENIIANHCKIANNCQQHEHARSYYW